MNTVVQLSRYRKPALAVSPPVSPDLPVLANRLDHIIQHLEKTKDNAIISATIFELSAKRSANANECATALAERFREIERDLTAVLNALGECSHD